MTNKHSLRNDRLITTGMLQNLPEPVQRYMAYTGLAGKPWIDTVRLKQAGRFRQGLDRPWMPMTAEQTYTTNPPAFVWNARFKVAGLPLMRARDKYESGQGHMFGKIAGLFTIFDNDAGTHSVGHFMHKHMIKIGIKFNEWQIRWIYDLIHDGNPTLFKFCLSNIF